MTKKTLAIDFDGVLHAYTLGWRGPRKIYDDPVIDYATNKSAIQWLDELVSCGLFDVQIFSSRSRYWLARRAMKKWLRGQGLTEKTLKQIKFPLKKPPAWLVVDDRAYLFRGKFPSVKFLNEFEPWYSEKIDRFPSIVCLCGGEDHPLECQAAKIHEARNGRIVLSNDVGFIPTEHEESFQKKLHLRRIDMADELLVLNIGGEVSEWMNAQIGYAKKSGKAVRYWAPQK